MLKINKLTQCVDHAFKVTLFIVLFCSCQEFLSGAELIFSSGFEGTESSGPTVVNTLTNYYGDIVGYDNITDMDWESDLESHYNIGNHILEYSHGGDEDDRFAEITYDPLNSGNKVLHYRINNATEPITGWPGHYKARIQSDIGGINNLTEITYKVKLYIHPDFNKLKDMTAGFTWMSLGEFWNNPPGQSNVFRITLGLRKAAGTVDGFQFRVTAETYNTEDGFQTVWAEDSTLNVPIGEWIDLEVYFKEGDDTEGKFSVSQTASDGTYNVIFDIANWTHDPVATNPDGLNFFNPMKLYCEDTLVNYIRNEGGALQVYWDDFELWKGDARTGIYEEVFDSISLIEAENSYSEAADVVADNIYVYSNYTQASNNSAVSIIDNGDAINIPFTVTQSGWYKLNLRVRSGNSTNDSYYFDDGYAIDVDNNPVLFTGDEDSITLESNPSTSYWGTLVSTVLQLQAGTHNIKVTAVKTWGRIDYLEVLKKRVIEAENSYTEAADVVADNIYVYSNYTQAGNNSAVSIIDNGDAISIPFTVTQSGWYKLNLRVRSGNSTNDSYYFGDGYAIEVDNNPVLFTGDEDSITLESSPATAYWGNLVGLLQLDAGSHTIKITAVKTWGRVDYLEVIPRTGW